MTSAPELPSPSEWGWNKEPGGGWSITWTTLPYASEACRELLQCGCKNSCRGCCKCQKSSMYSSMSVRWTVLCVTRFTENSSLLFVHNFHPIYLQLDYNKLLSVPLLPTNTEENSWLFDATDEVVLISKL